MNFTSAITKDNVIYVALKVAESFPMRLKIFRKPEMLIHVIRERY